jgi:hypothetical protein
MGIFDAIPVRSNADTGMVEASWWNTIRTALVNAFGNASIAETQFTIADNQSSYADITGLLLDASVSRALDIEYTIYRTNGSSIEKRENGILRCMYKAVAAVWSFEHQSWGDDALGNGTISAPLNVTSAGQVQYKSYSIGATYVGTIRYKIQKSFNKES